MKKLPLFYLLSIALTMFIYPQTVEESLTFAKRFSVSIGSGIVFNPLDGYNRSLIELRRNFDEEFDLLKGANPIDTYTNYDFGLQFKLNNSIHVGFNFSKASKTSGYSKDRANFFTEEEYDFNFQTLLLKIGYQRKILSNYAINWELALGQMSADINQSYYQRFREASNRSFDANFKENTFSWRANIGLKFQVLPQLAIETGSYYQNATFNHVKGNADINFSGRARLNDEPVFLAETGGGFGMAFEDETKNLNYAYNSAFYNYQVVTPANLNMDAFGLYMNFLFNL